MNDLITSTDSAVEICGTCIFPETYSAIDKSLKGKTIITTGTKNGVIRRLLASLPDRMIASIAVNQFKKKRRLDKEQ